MSHHHERRPSQRRSHPPAPGTISALLDSNNPNYQALIKTQIYTMTQIPDTSSIPNASAYPNNTTNCPENLYAKSQHIFQTAIEPLPTLDYHLLYLLISLAPKHQDRYSHLIEARTLYYQSHSNFQSAFIELQDAAAYSKQLATRFDILAAADRKLQGLPVAEGERCAISSSWTRVQEKIKTEMTEIASKRRFNNEELRKLLLKVEAARKARDETTTWFSSQKWWFLNHEMPALVGIGKQYCAGKAGANRTPPPSPILETSNCPPMVCGNSDDGEGSSTEGEAGASSSAS